MILCSFAYDDRDSDEVAIDLRDSGGLCFRDCYFEPCETEPSPWWATGDYAEEEEE